MFDKHSNKPRGFGFVFFKDKQGQEDAIRDMHDKVSLKGAWQTYTSEVKQKIHLRHVRGGFLVGVRRAAWHTT